MRLVCTLLLLCGLAPAAGACQDAVKVLKDALSGNEIDGEKVKAAAEPVVAAGSAAALSVLADGFDRIADQLQSSEVDLARAVREVDFAIAAKESDELQKDRRVKLEKAQKDATPRQAALAAVAQAIGDLLDAVTKRGEAPAVPALVGVYEQEHERIVGLERKLEERKGKLALLSSKVFDLEGSKAPAAELQPVALDKAEAEARVDRLEELLAQHRSFKLRAAAATGAVLAVAKGPEVDQAVKAVEKKVDSKAPPADRITWIDLYARFGRETVPAELWDVAQGAARQAKKLDDDLTKQRERFEKAKEAYFNSLDPQGRATQATHQAFDAMQKEIQQAADDELAMEQLRATAAGAVGPAIAALAEGKRDKAVTWALGIAKGSGELETRCALLESLGAVDAPAVREVLRKLLVEDKETKARLAALESLVTLKDAEAMEIVRVRLLAHANWRVRAAAVAALMRVPQNDSIPALITALDAESGRMREDVTRALQRMTGQRFAMSAPAWKKWWDENAATFRIEDVPAAPKLAVSAWDQAGQGKVTFYGISSVSKRVCFLLDVSKSMDEPAGGSGDKKKIDIAKEQLKQAVTGLADGDQFTIIYFAGTAARWAPKMTKVDSQSREKVRKWVDEKLEIDWGTNIHAGMKELFAVAGLGAHDPNYESAIDTVFFLSDGDATVGEITDPFELRKLIREWNRLSRIRIHCIGVGKDPNIGLLYGIAEDSGGQFQHR